MIKLVLFLLPLWAFPIFAQSSEDITIEIWALNNPIIHGNAAINERLLQEARYIISGIMYGWTYSYTPAYPARKINQAFTLQPISQIPWGDVRLQITETHRVKNTVYAQIRYHASHEQRKRIQAWNSLTMKRSTGNGSDLLASGLTGKLQAVENAILHAIHKHLRTIYPNRPREVHGSVILSKAPYIIADEGEYKVFAAVHFIVGNTVFYRDF